MSNLCVLCFHHHKAHHDGKLAIEGVAPHGLTFRWSHVGSEDENDAGSRVLAKRSSQRRHRCSMTTE